MTTAATLVQRTRRFMKDWPEGDSLTASQSSGGTTFTVADATIYGPGQLVQIDTEGMQVRSVSGVTVTVLRAARGTTAASHASGATVLVRPRWLDTDYLDAVNAGINATFPWIYQPVIDESITTVDNTYEYTVPNLNGIPIPYLSKLQFKVAGDLAFRDFRNWTVLRGSTPKIKFRQSLPVGVLRIWGYGPIPMLSGLTDTLNTLFPANAEDALTMFAAQYLLAGGEAARVREDTGARDQRENANRSGSSLQAANSVMQRFNQRISSSGMAPMPRHVVSTV